MSDLGGSIIFLGLAAALVVGGVFVALEFLDGVALILVASGFGLAAFWAVSYFVGPKLRERPILPAPADAENPYVQARQLERQHREDQERERGEQEQLALRRAIREIREELLDHKRMMEAALEADTPSLFHTMNEAWGQHGAAFRDYATAGTHRAVREAYRRIGIVDNGLEDFSLTTADRQRIGGAERAIDAAVIELDEEEP
jgi:hypothetical protein